MPDCSCSNAFADDFCKPLGEKSMAATGATELDQLKLPHDQV